MPRTRHIKPLTAVLAAGAVLVPAQLALASREHHAAGKSKQAAAYKRRVTHRGSSPSPKPLAQAQTPVLRLTVSGPGEPAARSAGDPGDTISDYKFSPASLTVRAGDTVTWFNSGPSAHTATARDGSFNTGLLQKGQSGSFKFTHAGTYSYYCTVHPFMHGTIVVLASATTPSSTTPASTTPASTTPTTTTPTTAQSSSTLPMTGIDLAGLGVAGLGLIGFGLGLRRRSRV
jgi:plastocyanin